jgi:hypothetical protein
MRSRRRSEDSDGDAATHRQQDLYYQELFQLKVACEYVQRYRDSLGRWVTWLSSLRAIASSGAIAAWAVVQSYPLVWGGIIAAAQVWDALRDVVPLTARHKATGPLAVSLDALFIEALYEWEGVYAGQFSDGEITERRRKLMERRHDVDAKHFPNGHLPMRGDLMELAEKDAEAYLRDMFGPKD